MANFNPNEQKAKACQKLIKEKEKPIKEHALKGWREQRTDVVGLGFGPYIAVLFQETTDSADMDAFRNQDDPVFRKWREEVTEFRTPEPMPSWPLREAGNTKMTEAEETPETEDPSTPGRPHPPFPTFFEAIHNLAVGRSCISSLFMGKEAGV